MRILKNQLGTGPGASYVITLAPVRKQAAEFCMYCNLLRVDFEMPTSSALQKSTTEVNSSFSGSKGQNWTS